jgi:hypothetical protein
VSAESRRWVIRPLTPEEVYTDREGPLAFFYKAALEAIGRRTRSTVLLGQQRMGKTEIFKRVVNRLFFEQERYADLSWFHSGEGVLLPRFIYIWHRTRLGAGAGMELDLEAAAGEEHWIGESKWRRERKADRAEVETLLRKAERVREKEGPLLPALRVWFFSHAGFTAEAEALMREHGVFWSTREDLDALLTHVGLRRLPEL